MASSNAHGHIINFDESARYGFNHLRDLDYSKAEALFNKAVSSGSTTFECDYGGFKLSWSGGSDYHVSKKY